MSSREIKPDAFLRDIDNATLKEHRVNAVAGLGPLHLGRQDKLLPYLHHVTFGSVLHTVQDSFAGAHASRENSPPSGMCQETGFTKPRRIVEFHTDGAQDGSLHDEQDSRKAMTRVSATDRWPDAVEATRNLSRFYEDRARWSEVQPYMQCLFELADERSNSSPGEQYRRR